MSLKVSIIVPVLNSHEIVRRQLLHYDRMGGLPNGCELILVDDGSAPPISFTRHYLRIYQTEDYRPWTWALARNAGARIANGNYLLMTDLDYILLESVIKDAMEFSGDKMRFRREFGVLDEFGAFTQDHEVLLKYGLPQRRIDDRGTKMPPHPNNFVMRKDLYWDMGGYREDLVARKYPQGEDRWFKRRWMEWVEKGKAEDSDYRPTIYMFPNGQFCGDVDYNPFNLFHTLTRKTEENPWHKRILDGGAR